MGIKIIVSLVVPAILITIDLIFNIGISTIYLFFGCYFIVFSREYVSQFFLIIWEKIYGNKIIRSNLMLSTTGLQVILFGILYLCNQTLSIEQVIVVNLISILAILICFFWAQVHESLKLNTFLKKLPNLYLSNFQQHKTQIRITWISIFNKILEANVLFFFAGVEQYAEYALYLAIVAFMSTLLKYFRVRSIPMVNAYKNELINYKFFIISLSLLCFLGFLIIYILILGTVTQLNTIWYVKGVLLLSLLAPPVGLAMLFDWIYTVILRQSINQRLEVNKIILGIGISYLGTILVSFSIWLGQEGYSLLAIIACKDFVVLLVLILYTALKVNHFE